MNTRRDLWPALYLLPLLLVVGVALAGPGVERTWQIETIEAGLGAYGGFASLALDAAGRRAHRHCCHDAHCCFPRPAMLEWE